MKLLLIGFCVALGFVRLTLAEPEPTPKDERTPKEEPASQEQKSSVVRVNSTNQAFDFFRPWSKLAPFSRRGLGAVIDGGKILVTAELVANSNYIELEKSDGGEKSIATVEVIDYEANLATLRPTHPEFLENLQALQTTTDVKPGNMLSVLQIESNGTPVSTKALVTSVQEGKYAIEDSGYLVFR